MLQIIILRYAITDDLDRRVDVTTILTSNQDSLFPIAL